MQVDTVFAGLGEPSSPGLIERLPRRAALFAIFALALASWVPIVLPVIAFLHR